MKESISNIIERQHAIASDICQPIPLPKFNTYTICNLRGGTGKTSLAFNLSYEIDHCLVVDTCPQGNLSYLYDQNFFQNYYATVNDMIMPYILTGLNKTSYLAKRIGATNPWFTDKKSFYISSSSKLYMLPFQMALAISQIKTLPEKEQVILLDNLLFSMKTEITREMSETKTEKCIIDTSPFFSGATHLSYHATDALIIPIGIDDQSINSLSMLLDILSSPRGEFRQNIPSDNHTPKIQMVVLTRCNLSTVPDNRDRLNQQTKLYVKKLREIVYRNIQHFTTDNPDNHILLMNDFLGAEHISTALSKPITMINVGETVRIDRVKITSNDSVEKIKKEISFLSKSIW